MCGGFVSAGKESAAVQREREERLRVLREKQNEERQRKLEELKQQVCLVSCVFGFVVLYYVTENFTQM